MTKKNNVSEPVPCPELLNYLIKASKKQFELYNFTECLSPLATRENLCLRGNIALNLMDLYSEEVTKNPYVKIFDIGPVLVNNTTCYQIGLVMSLRSPVQVIELVTMLDRLFDTVLHLNNYALVINQEACQEHAMLDLLGVTSTFAAVNSSNIFEFKSFFDSDQPNFCYGTISSFNSNNVMVIVDLNLLAELTKPYQSRYALAQKPPLYVLAAERCDEQMLTILIGDHLIANGLCVEVLFESGKEKNSGTAQELHAAFFLLVRPEDRLNNTILVKNMLTAVETTINQQEIVSFLCNKANCPEQKVSQQTGCAVDIRVSQRP